MPKIVFWTRASGDIGGGHLMRCLTLARELVERGADILFLVNEEAVSFIPELSDFYWRVGDRDRLCGDSRYLVPFEADAIVIDDYEIAAPAEQAIAQAVGCVVVIDDLVNRPHRCSLLLDQTFERKAEEYRTLVPEEAECLAGARYCLLRPGFAIARAGALDKRIRDVSTRRILISMGLTDVGGITSKLAAGILDASLGVQISVTVPRRSSSYPILATLAENHSELEICPEDSDMVRVMSEVDLAIGAGGTTTWERCCLGLPSILLNVADNQREISRKLADFGAVLVTASIDEVVSAIRILKENRGILRALSQNAALVTDGMGAKRVAERIVALCET